MTTRYYCETCDLMLNEHETAERREPERSEHFGQIAITYTYFRECAVCGDEVVECSDADAEREAAERRAQELRQTLIDIARGAWGRP